MENKTEYYIHGVNGPVIKVRGGRSLPRMSLVYVGKQRLFGEVVSSAGEESIVQIYEDSGGLAAGEPVYPTNEPMSIRLGPGLIGGIFDGIGRPLQIIEAMAGSFIAKGINIESLDETKKWAVTMLVKEGDELSPGQFVASCRESEMTEHRSMVPPGVSGRAVDVKPSGEYTVTEPLLYVEDARGRRTPVCLSQKWPVREPRPFAERRPIDRPLVTGQRVIDTLFPVAKGGCAAIPGPFGAGKTVLQHMEAKNADVDIVIVAACGERAGEVVEVLKEFPELTDPRTGRSLMERTIIICNTSSMPVAAREASVYTAVTMAEYYRQMGLNVLLLADSTSRWAQAMREMSGRLEEIPGEEAFPAYLESVIAAFYERAGKVRLRNGKIASVTIGGTVSPAGGNFEEPVTQATLKVVGAFHGLSRERSDARKYPSIHPIDSWSKYQGVVDMARVEEARGILRRSSEINQMMKVIGEEGTSAEDYILYQKGELLDAVYLQQNSFDPIDAACEPERQAHEFNVLYDVLTRDYALSDKKEIRAFFNQVRQEFLDWHGTVYGTPEFAAQETKLTDLYRSKVTG